MREIRKRGTDVRHKARVDCTRRAIADRHVKVNRSREPVKVAIVHGTHNGYVSRGWWNIGICSCAKVLSRDIPVTGAFLRGESPGGKFQGDTLFCTGFSSPFVIDGAHKTANCTGRARHMQRYSLHTLDQPRVTTDLTERGSHCID